MPDAPRWLATRYPGVQIRHRKACTFPEHRCRCAPSYRARDGRRPWSPVQPTLDAARSWQTDARAHRAPEAEHHRTGDTFAELWDRWLIDAHAGRISTRSKGREPYAPRSLVIYERAMKRHVLPTYGPMAAVNLTAVDWQLMVDDLSRSGLSHNTLQVVFNPVRAVYRWACAPTRRLLTSNETRGVEFPAKDEKPRDRIATPAEARLLLAALDGTDVLDFALALYAGLRNMERRGLDWSDILGAAPGGVAYPASGATPGLRAIRIRREITKSAAGKRTLPVIGLLRPVLMREWLRQGKPTTGRVVRGAKGGSIALTKQALRVTQKWEARGLERITPHEARHTFASYCIAANLNAKAVTVLMGHAEVKETFDRYGHLFPGHEDEAAGLLDAYLGVPVESEAIHA